MLAGLADGGGALCGLERGDEAGDEYAGDGQRDEQLHQRHAFSITDNHGFFPYPQSSQIEGFFETTDFTDFTD
ncbi:MAG: hypothetical protein Kow0099_22320 [Candidatus Abyssubacteria bacterium]